MQNNESAVIAKVCHDLITPFNAINLGLEAFEMSRDESLLSSIRESVVKANVTLKFMRELFSNRPSVFCYSAPSLKRTIAEYLELCNVKFDLNSDLESVASIAGKIVMYLGVISKEILAFGGSTEINIYDQKNEILAEYRGKNINIPKMSLEEEVSYKNVIRRNFLELLKNSGFNFDMHSDKGYVSFKMVLVD